MIRKPRAIGMAKFLAAAVTPWRPALRVRAKESKLIFYAHWRDVIGRHIAKYGEHEPQLTRFIARYLAEARSPGLFVDVGANIGWHTVHAAQYPTVETVVAFEPDAFNAWLLDRNLTANNIGKAVVNACAVGAARGIAQPAPLPQHQLRPSLAVDRLRSWLAPGAGDRSRLRARCARSRRQAGARAQDRRGGL